MHRNPPGLCLIANTAPVAFGALGIPIIVAGQVTGIDAFKIGAMAGRQLPLLSLFVPFWLVFMMDGLAKLNTELYIAPPAANIALKETFFPRPARRFSSPPWYRCWC